MDIKEIIKNGSTYDYKEGYYDDATKIESFLHYKDNNKGMDFDSIKPIVEVYRFAYDYLTDGELIPKGGKNNYNLKKHDVIYTGETMNSGLNILKKSMQLSPGYTEKYKQIGVSGGFSAKKNIRLFIAHFSEFQIDVNQEKLNEYLGLTHALGNFIPVPPGFNVGRNLLTSDYWDIALYNIQLWYETRNDEFLNRFLLKNNKKVIENTKSWLNIFGNWEAFIEKNYLKHFVEKFEDGELNPIPFWKEHFNKYNNYQSGKGITKSKAVEPQSIEEINEFLEIVNKMIICRGKFIITALEKKNK